MTVLEIPAPPDPGTATGRGPVPGRPVLRLVEGSGAVPAARRGTSAAVRRKRTTAGLVASAGLLLAALALPLGGAGGSSHASGSAPAGARPGAAYVVRPGDTLWTIAERVEPNGDPRPLVARMAAELGSDSVVPGEQVVVP
ncbi:MAG TPA: LysM peptidoglycan-binding domain-containing protein [Acidimicrobiales bacterium]|nr:LysM peptidoglycan-binding domain-containing protein [Acidimicrobiales bacterium]